MTSPCLKCFMCQISVTSEDFQFSEKTVLKLSFNKYVTLKVSFFKPLPLPPSPQHYASPFIPHNHKFLRRSVHTWHRYPLLSFISFVWSEKKQQRYTPTHDTSTHVFNKLNQIVRIKEKIIRTELECLFPMNYLIRKWSHVQNGCKNSINIDRSDLTINVLY